MSVLAKFLSSLGIDYEVSRVIVAVTVLAVAYLLLRLIREVCVLVPASTAKKHLDKKLEDVTAEDLLTDLTDTLDGVVIRYHLQRVLYRLVATSVMLLALF